MKGFKNIGEQLAGNQIGNLSSVARLTLPQNLLNDPGDIYEDFESTAGFTVNSGTLVTDTTYVKTGDKSCKLTAAIGGFGRITDNVTWDLSQNQEMRLWIYIPDATLITNATMLIRLAEDATYTNHFRYFLYFKTGWNLISVKNSDWDVIGAMTWDTPVTQFRFEFDAIAGETPAVYLDSLYFNVQATPALFLSFDDWVNSVYYDAYKYMQPKRVRGTFYITTDEIDGGGLNITAAQLREMQAGGWSISNHSVDTVDLTTIAQAAAEAKISGATAALQAIGITGNNPYYHAYPGGAYNDTVIAAAQAVNILIARSIDSPATYYHVLPLYQPFRVWKDITLGNTTSLATAKAAIDSAISRNELCIIYGHYFVPGVPANTSEWNIGDFEDLIDYAVQVGIPFVTIDDLYNLQFGSVTIPRAA